MTMPMTMDQAHESSTRQKVPPALTPSPRRTPPTGRAARRRPPLGWWPGCLAACRPAACRLPPAACRLPLGWRRFDGGGGGWLLL